MNIGVDATSWPNTRGYGRHARALLSALIELDPDNRYTFVVDWDSNGERGAGRATDFTGSLPEGPAKRVVHSGVPTAVAARASGHRSLGDVWRVSRALSDPSFDVVLFPNAYSYVPVVGRAKVVLIVHDVIAETYPELTLPSLTSRCLWRAKVWLARRQADALLTVSEYSRRAIAKRFKVPAEQIRVVGEAPDPVFRKLDASETSARLATLAIDPTARNVVYVGGFGPHKNLEMLLREFQALIAEPGFDDVSLFLVGENENEVFHSTSAQLKQLAQDLGIGDRVVFTGFLLDADLVSLLNGSAALVLPSLMEGFGLPAVEAAACGCPVIATCNSPLPDLLGDAGEFIDPVSEGALTAALRKVLRSSDLRRAMGAAGVAAASRLSWMPAASNLLDAMSGLVARANGRRVPVPNESATR